MMYVLSMNYITFDWFQFYVGVIVINIHVAKGLLSHNISKTFITTFDIYSN